MWIVVDRDTIHVHAFGRAWTLELVDPVERALAGGAPATTSATAPMPGTVIAVAVEPGAAVSAGERLIVIESMKMQTAIVAAARRRRRAPCTCAVGDTFDRGRAARLAWHRSPTRTRRPDAHGSRRTSTRRSDELPDQPRAQPRARRRAARDAARAPATSGRSATSTGSPSRTSCTVRERLDLLLDPGHAVPRAVVAGRQPAYDGEAPQAPARSPASASSPAAR